MARPSAFFLTPEAPRPETGGGGLRSASLLEYLRTKYDVQVFSFTLPYHSKSFPARARRNAWRFLRGAPPLLDRFAGFESQLTPALESRHYKIGVIEHFWCAPYAAVLRPHCDILALDLHNIESELASTHALATRGLESLAFARFATAYKKLEREWLPRFDLVLSASEEDRDRIKHCRAIVYPNALPEIPRPDAREQDSIAFSGNLEYHPNVEAVRWFAREVWPKIRAAQPSLAWKIIGCNEHAIRHLVKHDARIQMTGPVDDAITAIAESKIAVVPLLSGSGTRFKILEAWAAGRAVVSTKIGAEGLNASNGKHLLIANDPVSFAAEVIRLLNDAETRRELAEAGQKHYLDHFTWPAAWKRLEEAGI